MREREDGRFEITNVPVEVRRRDRQVGMGAALLRRYERVTFDKHLITVEGQPQAEYLTPGHPLLDSTIDLIIERYDSLLRQGAVLVDDNDLGDTPKVLVYLQHAVVDSRTDPAGNRRVISKRFEFVDLDPDGHARPAGWAPYLDLRPATANELTLAEGVIDAGWVRSDLEDAAVNYGVELGRHHLEEVRRRTLDRVNRTADAVKTRLESEIRYWDHRASQLRERELAGKLPASGMNSARARQRADELQGRLRRRLDELDAERQLSSVPPVVAGGALVLPARLLATFRGADADQIAAHARDRSATERAAVDAVLAIERALGRNPAEMPPNNKGFDIESRDAAGNLLFIEVKGRAAGAETFTVTRSEVAVGRNKPGQHILALAEVAAPARPVVRYLRRAFEEVSDLPFGTVAVNLGWKPYFEKAGIPS
jgi:hypothetical protein